MKLIVEFELGDIWEDYQASDEQILNALLRHNLCEVKTTIVKNLNLPVVRTRYITSKYTGEGITEGREYQVVAVKYYKNGKVDTVTIIDDNREEATWMRHPFNEF